MLTKAGSRCRKAVRRARMRRKAPFRALWREGVGWSVDVVGGWGALKLREEKAGRRRVGR